MPIMRQTVLGSYININGKSSITRVKKLNKILSLLSVKQTYFYSYNTSYMLIMVTVNVKELREYNEVKEVTC